MSKAKKPLSGPSTDKGLNLLRAQRSSAVYFLLFHTEIPLNDAEVQKIMGKGKNSRVRGTLILLKNAGYIKKKLIKSHELRRCEVFLNENKQGMRIDFPFLLDFRFGPLRELERYQLTPKFFDDLYKIYYQSGDEYVFSYLPEQLMEIIGSMINFSKEYPFAVENFKELREINNIEYLQSFALQLFFMREYISDCFISRAAVSEIIKKSGFNFDFNRKIKNRDNAAILKMALESQYLNNLTNVSRNPSKQSINEASTALAIHISIVDDDVLDDIFHLFVFTNPKLSKLSRGILSKRWDWIKIREEVPKGDSPKT